jgi:hypothetical protein
MSAQVVDVLDQPGCASGCVYRALLGSKRARSCKHHVGAVGELLYLGWVLLRLTQALLLMLALWVQRWCLQMMQTALIGPGGWVWFQAQSASSRRATAQLSW